MDAGAKIDWNSPQSHLFLNPRMPESEQMELRSLSQEYAQASHIWIASSGSSKSEDQSLKLIALSKKAFLASAAAVNQHLKSDAKDAWLQNLPRFHVGGLSIEARAFLSGARVVSQSSWNAKEFVQTVQSNAITLSALVPTQIFDLVQARLKAPPCLRAIVVGGAALADELYEQAIALGWPLLPSYGMTECCSQIATASLEGWAQKDRSLQLLPHVKVRTSSDQTLEISSPALFTGFAQIQNGKSHWQDPQKDGWYKTQDLVRVDGNVLHPLGRDSDFVKISGEGVDVQRLRSILEKIAQEHLPSDWQNLNLIAIPDERRGHNLILQVLQGTQAEKIQEMFNKKVAPYERIQEIRSVPELPWKKRNPQSW